MGSDEPVAETTVTRRGRVRIPASVRRRLDVRAGDRVRWTVTDDGTLDVAVVRQRYGVFADDDVRAGMGGDGLATHDIAGHEPSVEDDAR